MRGLKLGSVAVTFAAALTLAACGGDDEADEQSPENAGLVNADAVADETPEAVAEELLPAPTPAPADEPAPEVAVADQAAEEPVVVVAEDPLPPAEEETPESSEVAGPADDSGLIVGTAEAIDSATFIVDETRVMLYGLESVHRPQTCYIDGQPWACWAAAVRQLQTILSDGPVECTPMAPPDYVQRELALCEINGESLNERYIRSGFAIAIEDEMPEYAAIEAEARAEGIGLWQGQFQEPRDFRLSSGITARRP